MIAVDTNILVYAHRAESPWHERASETIRSLAESSASWAIPWPCVHEFLGIVTRPGIYEPPSAIAQALDQVEAWMESPSLQLLSESETHWDELARLIEKGHVNGGMVHDARVAALCSQHGVRELWSADRDFTRLPAMFVVRNPLIDDP